ncbi:hypothetical protein BGZ50_000979, partial [Haplosporangium sp. Z 11]
MIKTNLRKTATIIGYPDLEYLPDTEAAAILPYVVFEVSTAEQLEATARAGFLVPQEGGEPTKVYYQKYTHLHHEQHESRRVTLKSMAWNTKADDVHAAMAAWGTVASVRMGFNAQRSMATATVYFNDNTAVKEMADAKTSFVTIGRDVATVQSLGGEVVHTDPTLTMKLAQLPPFYMPIDVVHLLQTVPAPNAENSFQSITMPVNPHSKKRLPEAFVYFANAAQWERVRNRIFRIGNYTTAWVTTASLTCRICASPAHLQKECPTLQRRLALKRTRQNNTLAMQAPAP